MIPQTFFHGGDSSENMETKPLEQASFFSRRPMTETLNESLHWATDAGGSESSPFKPPKTPAEPELALAKHIGPSSSETNCFEIQTTERNRSLFFLY